MTATEELLHQLADVTESMGRVEERCAKLRELCEDMLSCIEIRAAFNRPPTEEMYEEFAQRAGELGIEVDEFGGVRMTVSEKLRLVQGLHSHAEIFGFKWDDDSDWTWHDVACKIADEVDAENAKLRELVRHLYEYRQSYFKTGIYPTDHGVTERRMQELGVEVNE